MWDAESEPEELTLKGHGDAVMDLAEVLDLADRPQEATEAMHQALKLYDQRATWRWQRRRAAC